MSGVAVAVHYDDEADAAYIALVDHIDDDAPVTTRRVDLPVGGPLLLELDAAGRLLGIEVLHADLALPPELIDRRNT